MLVVIHVASGESEGAKRTLRDGQHLSFGRTNWSDVSFVADEKMSSTHFSVHNDGRQCLVRDTGSTNGTLLNGEFVKQAALANGDRIQAGNTEFLISIRGQEPAEAAQADLAPPRSSTVVRDLARSVLLAGNQSLTYFAESCLSELVAYRHFPATTNPEEAASAAADQPEQNFQGPALVAESLSQKLNALLIVDYGKFGAEPPEDHFDENSPAKILFDWLPPEAATTLSPWALPVKELSPYAELFNAAWDQDAVLFFFSECPAQELLDHLAGKLRPTSSNPHQSMLGWCWPSVLAQLLAFRDRAFVQDLLGPCQAVLLEIPDLEGGWQIFAPASLRDHLLDKSGFRDLSESQAVAANES